MRTLVLSQRFTDDSNSLWRAALETGWDVVRARGFRVDPVPVNPVLYGETIFADAVAEAIGVSVVGPTSEWLPALPARYLRREVKLVTLGAAASMGFPLFVKPPDDKFFAARVYETAAELSGATEGLSADTPVLVSTPVRFEVEYRAFVVGRNMAATSVYIRGGAIAEGWEERPGEREGALGLLAELLADEAIALPPALVIDVARLSGGDWAVVEGNPAWASGLCGCDPKTVLPVLAAATAPRGTAGPWAREVVYAHPERPLS